MSDPNEFTPKEQFIISFYKQPEVSFRKAVLRNLTIIFVSIALVVYGYVQSDVTFDVLGYFVLLIFLGIRMVQLKRGLKTMESIITKYEAQLLKKDAA
jgi:hypothetical protein